MIKFIKYNLISFFIFTLLFSVAFAAMITPNFPGSLNNFGEGDIIEEEDWNAIELTIGETSTTSKSTLHGKWNDLFASTTLSQITTLLNLTNASSTQLTTTASTWLATLGGKVGIGTDNPQKVLHMIGGAEADGWARFGWSATEYTEIGHQGTNSAINAVGDGNLDFRHDGNTKMTITDAGYLGVSTTSPAYTLDVYGTARIDGTLTASGNITGANLNISNWDTAHGWGDHSGVYDILGQATSTLTSHTDTYNHANYNTAFGWGDHSTAGYNPQAFASSTYAIAGGAFHDGFSDFVADEHLNWTNDLGATNIHSGNYTDTEDDLSNDDLDALQNVNALTEAEGDLLYYKGGWERLASSTAAKVLKISSTTGYPAWETATGGGDITDVFDCATGDCNTMTVGTSEYLTYGTGYIDANRFGGVTTVSGVEFEYINGVTSGIQGQIDGKEGTLTNSAGLISALNDETGSGLAVFGTSPVITTSIDLPAGAINTATEIANDIITHAQIADSDQTDTKCLYFEDPTAADDFKSIWANKTANNFLITEIWAESDQTVTFMLQVDDGTPSDVDTVDLAPAAGEAEDTSLDGDTTVAAGEELDLIITSVTNTPTWVSICFTGQWVD